MSDAAMETVFDHFHARRRDDLAALAAGLAPDVVHQGVRPELVCTGRDGRIQRIDDYRTREEAARAVETPV